MGAGILVALSLPPFGWWPLGIAGLAAFAAVLPGRSPPVRAALGAALGLGQYAIGLWWVVEFNAAGYLLLVLLATLFTAMAALAVPARRPVGVLAGLPAALMVTDWIRGHWPFGGLPLGGISLGQAAGPLVPVARLGGPLLVTGVTAAGGAALAALAAAMGGLLRPKSVDDRLATAVVDRSAATGQPADPPARGRADPPAAGRKVPGRPRASQAAGGAIAMGVVVALVVAGRVGPDGSGPGPHRIITVAAVQGGGPRGLHESEVDPSVAFQRQLAATAQLAPPRQLVVWPEDVITVDQPIDQTPEAVAVGQAARRLGATVVAGVVEDVGSTQFRNAAVAWSPEGVIVARYDKVHRVPFGEYVPDRTLFQHLANLDLVPRDAIAGHGPGLLDTPAAPLGTVISYEVFFEDRGRDAIKAGGQLLIVPTNASSYSTSQVPSQEVAAAQLQAWATGRDVLQAAPTGYSALVDHRGQVLLRSTLGRQQVLGGILTLRTGRTLFVRFGDLPVLAVAVMALVAATLARRHPG